MNNANRLVPPSGSPPPIGRGKYYVPNDPRREVSAEGEGVNWREAGDGMGTQ